MAFSDQQICDQTVFDTPVFQLVTADFGQYHYISGDIAADFCHENFSLAVFATHKHLRHILVDDIRARWQSWIQRMLEVLQFDCARSQLLQMSAAIEFDNVQVVSPPLCDLLDDPQYLVR